MTYSLEEAVGKALTLAELDRLVYEWPSLNYTPHEHGQEQFHRAAHTIRLLFPGNRWGKTTAMAVEGNWWLQGRHPYQPTPEATPDSCIQVLWIAPQYKQFKELRPQLESTAFDRGFEWNEQDHAYRWPNGSVLWVIPADRDWTYIQGINPDLILCDEQPPLALWRELLMRRFGVRNNRLVKTRFIIAATATQGESWMKGQLYQPWLLHHLGQGLSESDAMKAQTHPTIWCWPRGGIKDNPKAPADIVKEYEATVWSSEAERRVRLEGGFSSWIGTPVFDADAMAWAKSKADELDAVRKGRIGSLVDAGTTST